MTFATDNSEEASSDDWRAEEPERERPLSPANISAEQSNSLLAGLPQEHYLLAGVAANMRSGFILLNRKERVTYSNPSAQRLLGISSSDLQPIFDVRKQLLSLAADPARAQVELDRVWEHPEQECSTDLALADAAVRWLRVQSFPVRDVPGRLLGRGVLLDDVTLELTSAQERSETLAIAAHELKTPLAIIKGCATTLLGSSMRWDPSLQREMLQMIDTHTDRLHDILNTLLDVWRLDAGAQNLRLAQVNIAELLHRLVERWQKNAPHHRFVLHMPEAVPMALCDALRLEQALNSLFDNAVTYSPNGGTVTIRLDANNVEIRLSITDEGIGISLEHLDSIFSRFYRIARGEQSPKGSGLGLAVARAAIEAHGGKIWADSPGLGQGATFYCTLPLAPRLPAPQQVQRNLSSLSGPLAAPQTGSSRCNVLIVENDARIARYLRAHLEEQRYRVHAVSSGVQFLRRLDLEEPDIILLATRLADMSGIELLQRLREFSQAPVIMLCDACDEDERVRLFDLGADDLVTKPFGMKELLARVRTLLRRSTTTEPSPRQAIFTTGELTIDYTQHQVLLQGRPIQLSRTEYKLLTTLAQNVGMVLTHELLLERVWGAGYNRDVDFIWVYISRLRRKIETDSRHPRYILTIPDVGYKLAKL